MFRRCLVVLALVWLTGACGSSGDLEVELHTAAGGSAGVRQPVVEPLSGATTSTVSAQSVASTSTPVSLEDTSASGSPASEEEPPVSTTTSAAATPCPGLQPGSVSVGGGDDTWWVEAATTDGRELRSVPRPLPGGAVIEIGSTLDLDGDDLPEALVVETLGPTGWLRVFDVAGCELVEPVDTVSGRPVELLLGREGSVVGGVACDGGDLVVTTGEQVAVVDSEGREQVRYQGESSTLGLFSSLWERSVAVPVTLEEAELGDMARLSCQP